MTTRFVSAVDGSNADNGTTWALAKQTVAGALAISAAGDVIVVDNAGTFTANAAITWTPPAGGIAIVSVTRSGASSFTWGAGAAEAVGASSNHFFINGAAASAMFVYGISLSGGTNNSALCDIAILNNSAASCYAEFDTCTFDFPSAAAIGGMALGTAGGTGSGHRIVQRNCTYLCSGSHTANYFNIACAEIEIINPTISFAGASKPAALVFVGALIQTGNLTMRDGDASGYNVSGGAYVSVTNLASNTVVFENLKLSSTPALTSGTWAGGHGSLTVRNCDSADTTYVFQYVNPYGTLTADNSVYVTSGGAQFNGAGASWKIVTNAACNEFRPFVTPPLFVWNATLTAQTASIEIICDNATPLTDRDIWSDLDFAASASFPTYTYQTNRNVNPFTGTAADHPTSTAGWTGAGGFSNPTKQKLQNAFTAAETGLLQARLSVGKASATIYADAFIGGVG